MASEPNEKNNSSSNNNDNNNNPNVNINTPLSSSSEISSLRTAFANHDTNPPLGWATIHAFESEHNILLPEPYRTCIAEIANGCRAGPSFLGFKPLYLDDHQVLSKPFPLTEKWIWEDDPLPDEDEEETGEDEERGRAVTDYGSIVIGEEGCGEFLHLIVTGEHRGHVWNICGEGAGPFGAPFGSTSAEPGFGGWVRHWAAGKYWWDILENARAS
jgi:hypothetical protein